MSSPSNDSYLDFVTAETVTPVQENIVAGVACPQASAQIETDGICLVDAAGRIIGCNATFGKLLDCSTDEATLYTLADFKTTDENIWRRRNGELIEVESSASEMFCAGQKLACHVVRHAIKREQVNLESEPASNLQAQRMLEVMIDQLPVGILFRDFDGLHTRANQAAASLIGIEREKLQNMTADEVVRLGRIMKPNGEPFRDEDIPPISAMRADGLIPPFEAMVHSLYGEVRHVIVNTAPVTLRDEEHHDEKPFGSVMVITDITERKLAEERMLYDALHDRLTKLPNRALFVDHLQKAMLRARRDADYLFAVLFLDFDRFKVINDSLGYATGDQLLVQISKQLQSCLRASDTVARLSGDEFALLLDSMENASEAIVVAEKIHQRFSHPFKIDGREIFVTASIGIRLSTMGFDDAQNVLRDADTAMYRAKSRGRARFEVFDKMMHARVIETLKIETDLRRALERNELRLYYQPIINLTDGNVGGFEALVRWQHPERGIVLPSEFVSVAEETGLIGRVGIWVLREACRQMCEWQKRATYKQLKLRPTMSINLSTRQLMQPDIAAQIYTVLDEMQIDPLCLKLEITESVVIDNTETTIEILKILRALGIELSIDDFGTGYSSLSYLHRFPVQQLKIDRSFVARMDGRENGEIVQTIISMAHQLGMKVVAEGVETEAQNEQLIMMGCDFAQGYLFSKPLDAGRAGDIINKQFIMPATSHLNLPNRTHTPVHSNNFFPTSAK